MATQMDPFIQKILYGGQPSPFDFMQGPMQQKIGTPGFNPNAPDPRMTRGDVAQQPAAQPQKPGVLGTIDKFLTSPGGGFLMNLLADSGYSPVPQSPMSSIGRASLMTQAQQQQRSMSDLQRQLIESQVGLNKFNASPNNQAKRIVQSAQPMRNGNIGYINAFTGELVDTGVKAAGKGQIIDMPGIGQVEYDPIQGTLTQVNPEEVIRSGEALRAGAVEGAKSGVKATADITKTNQDRAQTLAVWEASRGPLMSALKGTMTGPVIGLSPALTSEQQIADGAIAAVAPVLKQLFRAAGEGIFTDRDQALLLEMVPDRTDHPAARDAKMEMIDAIIAAKLAPIGSETAPSDDVETPSGSGPPEGVTQEQWDVMTPQQKSLWQN